MELSSAYCVNSARWVGTGVWASDRPLYPTMSIVGVLVAAGMMGGLALFLAKMAKQQHKTQKQSETGVEVVAMSQRIVRTLYDGDACLNTIGAGTAIQPGGSITVDAIKNKKGADVYKSLDRDPNAPAYGNRLLKVKSLKVVVASSLITGDQAEAKLEVVMRRESSAYTGQKTVTKKFPITLELDASRQLTGCVSDVGAIADPVKKEAKKEVCKEVWGSAAWDDTNSKCNPSACPSGEYLEGFDASGKVCKKLPKMADVTCPTGEAFNKLENGALVCGQVATTSATGAPANQRVPCNEQLRCGTSFAPNPRAADHKGDCRYFRRKSIPCYETRNPLASHIKYISSCVMDARMTSGHTPGAICPPSP